MFLLNVSILLVIHPIQPSSWRQIQSKQHLVKYLNLGCFINSKIDIFLWSLLDCLFLNKSKQNHYKFVLPKKKFVYELKFTREYQHLIIQQVRYQRKFFVLSFLHTKDISPCVKIHFSRPLLLCLTKREKARRLIVLIQKGIT